MSRLPVRQSEAWEDLLPRAAEVSVCFDGVLIEHHLLRAGQRAELHIPFASEGGELGYVEVRAGRCIETRRSTEAQGEAAWAPLLAPLRLSSPLMSVQLTPSTAPARVPVGVRDWKQRVALGLLSPLIALVAMLPILAIFLAGWGTLRALSLHLDDRHVCRLRVLLPDDRQRILRLLSPSMKETAAAVQPTIAAPPHAARRRTPKNAGAQTATVTADGDGHGDGHGYGLRIRRRIRLGTATDTDTATANATRVAFAASKSLQALNDASLFDEDVRQALEHLQGEDPLPGDRSVGMGSRGSQGGAAAGEAAAAASSGHADGSPSSASGSHPASDTASDTAPDTDGLGLRGDGGGGGGADEGTIGLGNIGTIGHGAGDGSGYGRADGDFRARRIIGCTLRGGMAPSASGGLDKAIIRRVVRAHLNEVRACYELELQHAPELSGRVSTRFTIAADGSVASALADRDGLASRGPAGERIAACVAGAIRRWTFPRVRNGAATVVSYPFSFYSAP